MANKYSKQKQKNQPTYGEPSKGKRIGAKIVVIIMIAAMVLFTIVGSLMFVID